MHIVGYTLVDINVTMTQMTQMKFCTNQMTQMKLCTCLQHISSNNIKGMNLSEMQSLRELKQTN